MAENIRSTTITSNPNELESKFVHHFYREIAQHFSDTRHRPWPKVAEFLTKLPRGSLVADVGTCVDTVYRTWMVLMRF